VRVRLFHKDYPEGRLFTSEMEVQAAEAEGAVDAPWKVTGAIPADLEGLFAKEKPINKEDIIAKPVPDKSENVKYCECGCGQVVIRRFAPGHWGKMMKKKRMEKKLANV
jgi:hypothetical protein